MTAKEINAKALNFLDKQEWKKAQDLFFKNAKENPSHQTYNNLGFFLIIEGLICSNGKVRKSEAKDVFSSKRKAIEFFDKIVRNLATPIDLKYVIEDEITV